MIELGPRYFRGVEKPVGDGIDSITVELHKRDAIPYITPGE
jgi:hypothetical protein